MIFLDTTFLVSDNFTVGAFEGILFIFIGHVNKRLAYFTPPWFGYTLRTPIVAVHVVEDEELLLAVTWLPLLLPSTKDCLG